MSALLIDDLMVDPGAVDRSVVRVRTPQRTTSLASVSTLPTTPQARATRGWRLTQRGIAVVMALFVGLFLTGVVVAVASFLSVSDAPLGESGSEVAAVSAQR